MVHRTPLLAPGPHPESASWRVACDLGSFLAHCGTRVLCYLLLLLSPVLLLLIGGFVLVMGCFEPRMMWREFSAEMQCLFGELWDQARAPWPGREA